MKKGYTIDSDIAPEDVFIAVWNFPAHNEVWNHGRTVKPENTDPMLVAIFKIKLK